MIAPPFSLAMTQNAPPSTFAMVVWLAMYGMWTWGLLQGWAAKFAHSLWAGTVLLPGPLSDLPTLKRYCRWGGVLFVLIAVGMCIAALIVRP
jgi:hypothetical protein